MPYIKFADEIDESEVLRYLGYTTTGSQKSADANLPKTISECYNELKSKLRPCFIAREFKLADFGQNDYIELENTDFKLYGKDIKAHLSGCDTAILFCVTLSVQADRLIRQAQIEDLKKGIILDCCATAAVEHLCDKLERMFALKTTSATVPAYFTSRFSPGYGDLSIDIQKKFLNLLDAPGKIGLCATSENILTPKKSVTAIIGVSHSPKCADLPVRNNNSCEVCNLKGNCIFRKRGNCNE